MSRGTPRASAQEYRELRAALQSEAEFQREVIAYARAHGWMVAHFRPGLSQSGRWQTAVQGDGRGFPDLVLVKPGRQIVFAELKRVGRYLRPQQRAWRDAIEAADGDYRLWRPSDWDEIRMVLG